MPASAHAQASASRISVSALGCVCAAGFAFSANYTNHAPLIAALAGDFHFSRAFGGLLTTGVFLTHASMQIPGGHLVDRLGSRKVLIVALAIVVIGNFAIAFANSYWQLLFWKVFTGFGTGACFVAGARYITGIFSGRRLHLAQGLYGGSILLGSGFVLLAVPRLLELFSWRGAFLSTAAVASAVWIVWILISPSAVDTARPTGTLRHMLLHRELWLLGLAQMATFGLAMVAGAWVIAALRSALGLSLARAGLIGSTVLLLGIVMRPLGGALVQITGVGRLIRASLLINAVGCFVLALEKRSTAAAAFGIVLLGTGCGLPYAALFTRAAALFPGRAAAAMGLVNTLGIVMILAGAPLVGKLADWSGSFRSSFLALGAFSLAAAAVCLRIADP